MPDAVHADDLIAGCRLCLCGVCKSLRCPFLHAFLSSCLWVCCRRLSRTGGARGPCWSLILHGGHVFHGGSPASRPCSCTADAEQATGQQQPGLWQDMAGYHFDACMSRLASVMQPLSCFEEQLTIGGDLTFALLPAMSQARCQCLATAGGGVSAFRAVCSRCEQASCPSLAGGWH